VILGFIFCVIFQEKFELEQQRIRQQFEEEKKKAKESQKQKQEQVNKGYIIHMIIIFIHFIA